MTTERRAVGMAAVPRVPVLRGMVLRAWWWRHPEAPAAVAIAAAWAALAAAHLVGHGTVDGAWSFDVAAWVAMVTAMMVPGSVPMLRRVAFNSLWTRRNRSASLFAVTYVACWTLFGTALAAVVRIAELSTGVTFAPGQRATGAALLAAAAWQLTPTKARSLRRCHLRTALAPRGRQADRSVVEYGLFHARACVGSCGPIMAAMFVAHDFHLMVPLSVITLVERYQRRPNLRAGAVALGVLAAVARFA